MLTISTPKSVIHSIQVKDIVRKLALEQMHTEQLKTLTSCGLTVKEAIELIRFTDRIILENN